MDPIHPSLADLKTVGVVGGGAMGSGIAHVCAAAGFEVLIADASAEMREKGVQHARDLFARKVKKGQMDATEAAQAASRIRPAEGLEALAGAQLVIEAVTERLEVKLEVFRTLDALLPPEALIASNTSALPIRSLAGATGRPGQVLGLHFFNPAPVMALVEVIAHPDVSDDTMTKGMAFCKAIGKQAVRIGTDSAGFLVNRLLLSFMNEAVHMLEEHGPDALEAIEVMTATRGFPMGPFTLADLVGIEVCVHVLDTLQEAFGDAYPRNRLLDLMVASGRYGQKRGKGFRAYDGQADDWLADTLAALPAPAHAGPLSFSRLMLAMTAEAGRMLDEGIVEVADIDLAMKLGTGLETGPMAWIDGQGVDAVIKELETLAPLGPRFRTPDSLTRALREGRTGRGAAGMLPPPVVKPPRELVKVRVEDGVAVLGLCNPPANVLSTAMLEAIDRSIKAAAGNPAVKAIVLVGQGKPGFFVAGADIKEIGRLEGTVDTERLLQQAHAIFQGIWNAPVPVIAAINGWCLGGGLELALSCHLRVASASAMIGLPEVTLGIIPGFGGTQRLARLVGASRALELTLAGTHITAEEAGRIGLVNRVVPEEEIEASALALGKGLAARGRVALGAILKAVRTGLEQPLEDGLSTEVGQFVRVMDTHDRMVGVSAFLRGDKNPRFTDR
ncbi:MAG: 3-hydroxyacyl-CoA dehydrogenase NAD-binding domain-containing protein [Candidatus Sericytochromatia bacterium]|nr:3-hydroxyacyl-CoA dehydrogenase NAD-binding domain-containing protein [Candidatus Sericytochromatia bacterium]